MFVRMNMVAHIPEQMSIRMPTRPSSHTPMHAHAPVHMLNTYTCPHKCMHISVRTSIHLPAPTCTDMSTQELPV